jgi:threonine/homoserine/homoserine lactone efflux protein
MRILRYSFYRFYQLLNSAGNTDVAEYSAIGLMSILIGLNTFTLFSIVYVVTGVSVDISQAPKLFSVILFLGLLIFFYVSLVRKDKHIEIIKEYEHETSKKRIIGTVITISYILMSIGLLMFCTYLMMQRNRGLL